MFITCESGCALVIPEDDPVFRPVGDYRPGDPIDPETVDFDALFARDACRPGSQIIVNNRVEVIRQVGWSPQNRILDCLSTP